MLAAVVEFDNEHSTSCFHERALSSRPYS